MAVGRGRGGGDGEEGGGEREIEREGVWGGVVVVVAMPE